jgi:hypothetical protein
VGRGPRPQGGLMAIGKPRGKNAMRPVYVCDPRVGRKVYVGSRAKLRGPGGAGARAREGARVRRGERPLDGGIERPQRARHRPPAGQQRRGLPRDLHPRLRDRTNERVRRTRDGACVTSLAEARQRRAGVDG